MKIRLLIYSFLIMLVVSLTAQETKENSRLEELIFHVKKAPRVKTDYQKIADHLVIIAKDDLEKAKLIYLWLCFNIKYDALSFQKGKYQDPSPTVTMLNRKAVCSGYGNLFQAMGKQIGLEIEVVGGYSKGYGYRSGTVFKTGNHAWNVVKIGGKSILVDATWGAGYVQKKKGKLQFVKKLNMYWFNTNPYEFAFTHLPDKAEKSLYQFINPVLTLQQFSINPTIDEAFFKLKLVDAKKALSDLRKGMELNLPESFTIDIDFEIQQAPLVLEKGKTYQFKCSSTNGLKMAVITKNDFYQVHKSVNSTYVFEYTPQKKGDLQLGIQYPDDPKKQFWTVLKYTIKK
ncbi:MAG: transglutaminase domain-containing protein [Cyclobacteriaceae bacterium]